MRTATFVSSTSCWSIARLASREGAKVTDVLLAALEMVAHEDGIRCLMFLLSDADIVMKTLEEHGYRAIVADRWGVWVEKKLGDVHATWCRFT